VPAFQFTVLDGSGTRTSGVREAGAIDELVKTLQQQYTTVISVKPASLEGKLAQDSFERRVSAFLKKLKERVPGRNIVFFTRQLSTMFSAGMTVERSLAKLGKVEKNKNLKRTLMRLTRDVQSGKTLSDALAAHPGAFGPLYVALVRAGEMSGTLGEILDRLADHLERTEEMKGKVTSALTYPVVVLGILALCVYLLVAVVAPRFDRVYESFGAQLPALTQMLMTVSRFLVNNSVSALFAGVLCVVLLIGFGLTDRGALLVDKMQLKLPVVGTLVQNSIMARFSRTLGLLMSTSVPVLDGLQLVSRVVNNRIVASATLRARESVQTGRSIHASLDDTGVFPDILLQLTATGEETGALDTLLIKAGEYYEKLVNSMIGRITSLLEPLLIVLLGVIVGTLVIIIYLPIFYLGNAMKQGLG